MANANKYGLRWVKPIQGTSPPKPVACYVASAYQASPSGISCDLNIGDPVKRVSDGTVALIAGTDAPFGVICGIDPYWNGTRKVFGTLLPGGTTWGTNYDRISVVHVIPVAGQIFEAVADDGTSIITLANWIAALGENVNLSINPVAGTTLANPKVAIAGHATTNTLNWRLWSLTGNVDADVTVINYPLYISANYAQQPPYTILGV